ncbi:hypothetical protein AVEN_98811-1 [Araneus ventricosus]|uniref:Uncharacterized protein n=1 Tax=Araneus ventricosus TaxID=182803 RepID=A0A4Y2U2C7_ARAVE|nr:hypothetical protein AVEN_98811-1 [Araneus ventricosus]
MLYICSVFMRDMIYKGCTEHARSLPIQQCPIKVVVVPTTAWSVLPDPEIYDENVMTDGMVRKWVQQFNDGRTSVHDEARCGRPSIVNDGLVAISE